MNQQQTAQQHQENIDKQVLEIASQLGNSLGFFRYYWQILPRCKTQKAAFQITNLMYRLIFSEEKYTNYDAFRKQLNRKRKEI